jgi:integrase/recombinase XerD
MPHDAIDPATAATSRPSVDDILGVWRADGRVHTGASIGYLQHIRRFRAYCIQCGLDERLELTRGGARRFIAWYDSRRHLRAASLPNIQSALSALSRAYQALGLCPPVWREPRSMPPPATVLLQAYAEHLARRRGNPSVTIEKKLDHICKLQRHLVKEGKTWRSMVLEDIDEFLIGCTARFARTTVSDIACSVRCFSRFLFASGNIAIDLADAVVAPVQPRYHRPRRALPWEDVQRLLRAIDTSTALGLRDYALLLMMSIYGCGAGEAIRLEIDNIDWSAATLKLMRPKTGVAFTLPLLPPVAKALACYLRDGRPRNTRTRHVFLRTVMPFEPLSCASAIRHIIVKHARIAGLDAPFLGSHVLRHSNAARQVDLGVQPQVLSDLLGHRDPASISAYVRIATGSLRDISLPVPT